MISSISGNHVDPMPGVPLPDDLADENNGDGFPERFSKVSPVAVEPFDVADFSTAAGLLSEPLLLPTIRNVKELSADLSEKLTGILSRAGMSAQLPVQFRVDGKTGLIEVRSDSPDAQRIDALVNADPDVKRLFQAVEAISTHAYEMPKHLKFQREYLASNNPEQIVAKYSSLFGPQSGHDISMIFDGSAVRMLVDGKEWSLSSSDKNSAAGSPHSCFGR